MRLLLVEDEVEIARNMQKFLHANEFDVDVAENLRIAWEAVQSIDYPLVILDRRLPDGDGVDLIRRSRRLSTIPRYLILSALGDVNQRIDGLNLGAGDYMAKPFEPKELLARIRAMLRMPRPKDGGIVSIGGLSYDRAARQFKVQGNPLELRRREFDILEVLTIRQKNLVGRDDLVDHVYGFDEAPTANTLDSHISRLRQRLVESGAGVKIQTARNLGYVLQEES